MAITPQRAEVLDFTSPYYYDTAVAAVRPGSGVTAVADLSGKRIGVTDGSTYEAYLQGTLDLPDQGPIPSAIDNPEIVKYTTDQDAIDDLAAGSLDAVISARPELQETIDHGMEIEIVGVPLFTEELAAAVV